MRNTLQQRINALLLAWASRRGLLTGYNGIIRIRETPFETEAEYKRWWLPTCNESGRIVQRARMGEQEKERYTRAVAHNLITLTGKQQLLNYLGSATPLSTAFCQFLAVDSFGLSAVSAGDTTMPNELARVAPDIATLSSTSADISALFGGTLGNGTWNDVGIWGNGATLSANTGFLYTHALIKSAYVKATGNVSVDYVMNLN